MNFLSSKIYETENTLSNYISINLESIKENLKLKNANNISREFRITSGGLELSLDGSNYSDLSNSVFSIDPIYVSGKSNICSSCVFLTKVSSTVFL